MSTDGGAPVIRVENLCLGLATGDAVVQDVSFSVNAGEILGLVGESGSGKTTTALALLGYTRPGVVIRSGAIEVGGQSVIGRDASAVRSLRGRVVSYVPQDPGGSLNPSLRVGDRISGRETGLPAGCRHVMIGRWGRCLHRSLWGRRARCTRHRCRTRATASTASGSNLDRTHGTQLK